jgi:hypothetical protein
LLALLKYLILDTDLCLKGIVALKQKEQLILNESEGTQNDILKEKCQTRIVLSCSKGWGKGRLEAVY